MCSSQPPTNISRYCNAAVDAAERDQLNTYSMARRKRDFALIEQHVAGDLPALWMYWPRLRYVMNPDLRGFAPNCCGPAWNAYRWTI
jgi:ABC-type transport system substrate-binding protein